ncbi:MAG: hypothetical protein D3913_11700 [Candidatus Electrothrix sp. LOE1_4_5]|nr:hypothetical protein [Candidatus Electrothrix gigas]
MIRTLKIQREHQYTWQTEMIKLIKENSLFVCIVTFFCIFIVCKTVHEYRNLSLLETKIYYEDSKVRPRKKPANFSLQIK